MPTQKLTLILKPTPRFSTWILKLPSRWTETAWMTYPQIANDPTLHCGGHEGRQGAIRRDSEENYAPEPGLSAGRSTNVSGRDQPFQNRNQPRRFGLGKVVTRLCRQKKGLQDTSGCRHSKSQYPFHRF